MSNKRQAYAGQQYAAQNPGTAFFNGDYSNLQTIDPEYYQYLTNPTGFDYTSAPTGEEWIAQNGGGSNNDFTVDWDSILSKHQSTVDAAKAASDKAAADAADAQATAAAAAKRTSDINTAKTSALTGANQYITDQGLDPGAYGGRLNVSIQDILNGLGDTGDPYAALNGKTIGADVLNDVLTGDRAKYSNQVSNALGPNYGDKTVDSHLLDGTISDILSTQQQSAQDYLDRGLKRGIYNDTGYQAGEKMLGADASTGLSTLQGLGQGVIDKYQTQANDVATKAAGAASGYNLGGAFNLDDYLGQGNAISQNAQKYGSGDLTAALGGQNFFDFGSLNQSAGQAQGATNLRDNDLQAAIAYNQKKQSQSRGLGSQGAF